MNEEKFLEYLFLSTVIAFFAVLSLVLYKSSVSEPVPDPVCECTEWLNHDQDIKCVVIRDTRKYGHKGREIEE